MKFKQFIFTIVFFTISINSIACSCGSIKIVNAFSNLDFIGIVEFESINRIESSLGLYKSKINIKQLYKGNRKVELFINSQEGSSCSFMPKKNRDYFILGYKNEKGIIETSFCLAFNVPNNEKLSILRKLVEEKISENISLNLRQILKEEINYKLFEKSVSGIFLYKVILNSDLTINKIIPQNENAKKNYNEKIRIELNKKIYYKKIEEELKVENGNLTSYIILNWFENYENKRRITSTNI